MKHQKRGHTISRVWGKHVVAVLLVSLAVMLALTRSTDLTLAQGGPDATIRLKSREFVPVPGIEPDVQRQQQSAAPEARLHVLMQFWQIPADAELAELENAGVELLAYVPTNAWFASVPAGLNLQSSKALNNVRWIGTIQPDDRTAPNLRSGGISQYALNNDGTVRLEVRFFADISNAEATQVLDKYRATIEDKVPDFQRFTVRVDSQAIVSLAGEDAVQWITTAAPPKTTHNDGSRARTNVDIVQAAPYNLSGNGVNLGEWDGGQVDAAHPDFAGRLTVVDAGAPINDHATHVAGTMAGDGSNSASQGGTSLQWRGMAPGAHIFSYYWDNHLADHNGAINTHDIDLSQNSWGYTVSSSFGNCNLYGNYDYDAPDFDDIITGLYGKRISVIFAAGNERDDGDCGMSATPPYLNYSNVGPPATAKNIIAVGAANSNDDSMTDFSSWGPVDDGRLKPEVVAPGCESTGEGFIRSTLPGGGYGGPDWCGTSMAAPAVSGIAGLLIEQYRAIVGVDPLPSTLKAILVQTAVDLDDGTSFYNPGPDYVSGYGRVDAQSAADLIIAQELLEDQIGHNQTDLFTINVLTGTPELKVTLAWDDEPGAVNATTALVNNLDLILIEPDGSTTHRPWILNPASPGSNATRGIDSINNLEQVQVINPAPGTWQVQVVGTNVPVPLQDYSLAGQTFISSDGGDVGPLVYNSHIIDDDNNNNSSGNNDGIINPGETIELFVELLNDGTDNAVAAQATISTNSPYVTFSFNTSSGYGDISAGGTATNSNDFDFEVSSSTPNGHVIQFELSISASNGGPWSDSFTIVVGEVSTTGNVALISDQTELQAITSILDDMSLNYEVLDNNWDGVQGIYSSDYDLLSDYDVVVWYASGEGQGRLITQQEHDALELYLQAGGRLLVTGYDTLGSPTDPLMADLIRSSNEGDGPFVVDYSITNGNHPIADGPFGTFPAGTSFSAADFDHDQAEADAGRGAITVAELTGGRDKIVATELASGGIVVYWNGNRDLDDWLGALTSLQVGEAAKRHIQREPAGLPSHLALPPVQSDQGFIVNGVLSETPPSPLPEPTPSEALRRIGPIPEIVTVINFDDTSQPCLFEATADLKTAYQGLGVTFDGPGGNEGGAVLNECSGFNVTGYSPPNFLAFNANTSLSVGGSPTHPEEISFAQPVSFVQISAGSFSGRGQTLTVEAFDTDNNLLGSDTITLDAALQPLSIAANGIVRVVITSPASAFALDDLIFDPGSSAEVESNVALFKNTLDWLTQVPLVGDPHEPNDTVAECTSIFSDVAITDPTIDPPGDQDYFCFDAQAGQTIAADIDASQVGSPLDPVLTLLDSDGTTILAESDDFHGLDSYLEYTLPGSGLYYLRVQSFGDPCCGGPDYTYSLLLTDITAPAGLPFFDDMEAGLSGWAADGLWHQVQDGVSPYPNSFSPTHSWWYGQDSTGDYDTGSANSGNLTSPSIQIPANSQASLSFWNWYETEPVLLPQTIYFDIYHDTDGNDNVSGGTYTDWANMLAVSGHTLLEYNQPISSTILSGHHILALFDPEVPFSASEIVAINDFIQAGGRVVALGEANNLQGVNTVLNALIAGHGITLNSDVVQDSTDNDGQNAWPLITNFANDPRVRDVNNIVLYSGSSLSLGGAAMPLATGDDDTIVAVTNDARRQAMEDGDENQAGPDLAVQPLDIDPNAPVVMGYTLVGAGELIVIGDSGLWTDEDVDNDGISALDEYDNTLLASLLFSKQVDATNWDQKWVQISVDGGPFQDLLQITGGPINTWHETTADLSAYQGTSIRLRFHFDTGDAVRNGFRGWYIDDVRVAEPSTPAGPIVYSGQTVDDDDLNTSSGNGDGQANAGETIELYVELENQSTNEARNVVACLIEDSPYVNGFLFNNCSAYNSIAGGAAGANLDDFDLTIDSAAPPGHVIHFTVAVSADNGGPWTTAFDIVVDGGTAIPGPLAPYDLIVDDDNAGQSAGNNDGLSNPGETVELYVEALNAGQGTALSVIGCLQEGSPYLDGFLFNDCSNYGDIPGGGLATNTNDFDFIIDPLTPPGHVVPFTMTVTAESGGPWVSNFDLVVVSTGASLRLEPVDQDVPLSGADFIVKVMVDNAADLGAFEFELVYSPTIVHVNEITLGGFLGSTGRTVTEVGPTIDNTLGRTSYGAFSLGSSVGPSGGGLLATASLKPLQEGDSDLILENIQLTDTDTPASVFQLPDALGHVAVTDAFFADVNNDGQVNITDIQFVSGRFGCVFPDACYEQVYDLDDDLDIDILDVQIVACYWGWPDGDFNSCYTPTAANQGEEQQGTVVRIQPDMSVVDKAGETFTVAVEVAEANNLGGFQLELHYDSTIVEVDKVTLGSFLGSTGRTVFEIPADIDNSTGVTTYGAGSYGSASGPSGNGTLAIITMAARTSGVSDLDLQSVILANISGAEISATVDDGVANVALPALVISKTAQPDPALLGERLTYTLTISNLSSIYSATNVTISDRLPDQTAFAEADHGGILDVDQVRWTVPMIEGGEILTLTFAVTVSTPFSGTELVNVAYSAFANDQGVSATGDPVTTSVTSVKTVYLPLIVK